MLAPTRATHQRICHREGRQARGDLPVQSCGYRGTDVEATPYREIPTDGIAVLGMTYFYISCRAVNDRPYKGIAPMETL